MNWVNLNQGILDVRDLKHMTDLELMCFLNNFPDDPKYKFVEKEWNKRKLGYKHLK